MRFLLCLLFAVSALAQSEVRETNLDLRGTNPLFLVERSGKERLELTRGSADEFFLERSKGEDHSRQKLSRGQATKFDEAFSAAFLKVLYELPADPKGCDADWRMVLRGEEARFCGKNEQKHQAIEALYSELREAALP